jgi:hypothetical protein
MLRSKDVASLNTWKIVSAVLLRALFLFRLRNKLFKLIIFNGNTVNVPARKPGEANIARPS